LTVDPWSNPVSSNGIYDPFSPEVIDDPYPFYRRLLRDSRVHHEALLSKLAPA